MMLGGGHHVEAGVVGEHGELADLVEHLLVALVVAPDRTQALPVLERAGNGGQDEKHELHGFLLFQFHSHSFWRRRSMAGGKASRLGTLPKWPDIGSPHQPGAQAGENAGALQSRLDLNPNSGVRAAQGPTLPAGDYKLHWAVRTMTKVDVIQGDIPFTVKDQP